MEIITVAIVDDHSIVTEGLRLYLKADNRFRCVGCFANSKSFLDFYSVSPPDLVILDLDLPDMNGMFILKKLKEDRRTKVIILTLHEGFHFFKEAIQLGVDGYLLKTEPISFIPTVLMMAQKGEVYISKAFEKYNVKNLKKLSLSQIQLDIITLLFDGLTYSEIAEKLDKSPKTIDYHLTKIKKKLNVKNNLELITHMKDFYYK